LLGITKSAPAAAFAYTLNVMNAGPNDAADVVLNDPLPASFFVDSINAPGWSCTTPIAGSSGTVNCTIAQFGSSGTITIQGHRAVRGDRDADEQRRHHARRTPRIIDAGRSHDRNTAGTSIANQATISFDADGNHTNDATGIPTPRPSRRRRRSGSPRSPRSR
jgi:hypothetical protein